MRKNRPKSMATALEPHDDLADLGVGLHEREGGRQIGEREDLVDHRPQPAVGQEGQHVLDEAAHGLRPLTGGAEAVAHAEDGQPLAVQRLQIERGAVRAVHVADDGQPPFESQRLDALGEHRAAHVVDDQVHALAVGGLHDGVVEVGGARADADVEAELLQARQLVGRARGADDARAERLARLERGHADARGHAGHQQPLAGRQVALGHQHVVDDQEHERRGGGLLPAEGGRHAHGLARVHQRVLGEAARAAPHHGVAGREAGDALPGLHDFARALAAARLGGGAGLAAQQFAAGQRGGVHAHEQLARFRLGRGRIAELDGGAGRAGRDPVGLHARSSRGMVASPPLVGSRRTLYTVRTTVWITGGWIAAALLVHWLVRRVPTHLARELTAVATGAAIGLGSAWFELRAIPRLVRALTMGGLLLVRTFFYVALCAAAIHAVTMSLLGVSEHGGWLGYYTSAQYRDFVLGGRFVVALAILTLVSFVINFVRQLDRMLGPGTLMNLLLGRYHRPVAEDRIFMFLDLNDSTAIAARLGPLRFNDFKNDFFHDIAEPVLETRGQIYQYVGDEAVVTWTTERGLRQGNCLRCVFLVSERIHEQKDRYRARYGIVPEFKAGLHGGPVVTAEIGDIKKDIVHSGDTVNTAARVEAQCRPLERRVLVSAALLSQCQVPEELELEDMGERELRGKVEALRLYSVRARV